MSVKVENTEKNMVKLTVEMAAADVEKAMQAAYEKNKGKFQIPGFRKGHAPRQLIEKMYGKGMFLEDAVNDRLPDAYEKAVKESGLEIVSQPEISFETVEVGKDVVFTATVAVKPEVTLGEYKGLEVKKAEISVTEEDVLEELKKEQEKNAVTQDVTDRPAKMGDELNIDFVGTVDGTEFPGGTGKNYPLTLGSHSFIDNFEDQLVGKSVGEETDVAVTFPAEYHAEELAGKPAVFHVTVNGIKEKVLPELTDEFADEVSEFSTLEELKADTLKKLTARREENAKTEKENALVEKAVENARIDVPKAMIETQARQSLQDFKQRLQYQGIDIDMYYKYTDNTEEKLLEQMRPDALRRIRTRLTLEAIAKAEDIQVSEEEFGAELEKMAGQSGMDVEKLKTFLQEEDEKTIREDVAVQKAITFLCDNAKEI